MLLAKNHRCVDLGQCVLQRTELDGSVGRAAFVCTLLAPAAMIPCTLRHDQNRRPNRRCPADCRLGRPADGHDNSRSEVSEGGLHRLSFLWANPARNLWKRFARCCGLLDTREAHWPAAVCNWSIQGGHLWRAGCLDRVFWRHWAI